LIVDSETVDRVVSPACTEELADAVGNESGALSPVGSGTALSFGNPLEAIDCVIETRRMDRIIEYVPADLTVHVEAGVRLGDLQDALAANDQMIPLDPWNGRDRTVGGVIATNAQGPLRAVGSVRDWVIGMKVVHADGQISRTGGRVVKNVSGYDLAKLYTGSLGSLVIVSEVSFKVSPRYKRTATARVRMDSLESAAAIVSTIRSGPVNPISLVWSGPDNWVYVRFGDSAPAVLWQLDHLPKASWERLDQDEETQVWGLLQRHYDSLGDTVVRAAVPPTRTGEALGRIRPPAWLAHAASGTLLMACPPERILELRLQFPAILERAPIEVRRRIPTFGVRGLEWELMLQVKKTFDPDRRFNPGRHVDGEGGREDRE
jgi:glycolate oxidase FAD binding subunit